MSLFGNSEFRRNDLTEVLRLYSLIPVKALEATRLSLKLSVRSLIKKMNVERRTKRKPSGIWLGLILIVVVVFGFHFYFVSQQTRVLGVGEELMADDFGFTLESATWSKSIDNGGVSISRSGQFLTLKVLVSNHAKRVDFTFDPNQIIVESEDGRRFVRTTSSSQPDATENEKSVLSAGESQKFEITFDVPGDAKNLRMRVQFGGRAGEILDWLLYGERWFQIAPE